MCCYCATVPPSQHASSLRSLEKPALKAVGLILRVVRHRLFVDSGSNGSTELAVSLCRRYYICLLLSSGNTVWGSLLRGGGVSEVLSLARALQKQRLITTPPNVTVTPSISLGNRHCCQDSNQHRLHWLSFSPISCSLCDNNVGHNKLKNETNYTRRSLTNIFFL